MAGSRHFRRHVGFAGRGMISASHQGQYRLLIGPPSDGGHTPAAGTPGILPRSGRRSGPDARVHAEDGQPCGREICPLKFCGTGSRRLPPCLEIGNERGTRRAGVATGLPILRRQPVQTPATQWAGLVRHLPPGVLGGGRRDDGNGRFAQSGRPRTTGRSGSPGLSPTRFRRSSMAGSPGRPTQRLV